MELRDCWAKTQPFQSVRTHAIVTGLIAKMLFIDYLSPGSKRLLSSKLDQTEKNTGLFLAYLASLHDIGKIEPNFQSKDAETNSILLREQMNTKISIEHIRHEITSAAVLKELWIQQKENRRAANLFSGIVGAHHQGKYGKGGLKPNNEWARLRHTLESEMRGYFQYETDKQVLPENIKNQGLVSALFLGVVILADWIASGTMFADAEEWIDTKNAAEQIQKKTEHFLSESGLKPLRLSIPESFCGVWCNIPEDGRRSLQTETEKIFCDISRPSVILIEAPMGEGKTEAGIYAALQMAKRWGKDGLYMALPTAATANQMVERVRALLSMHEANEPVRLLHGTAWMTDTKENKTGLNTEDCNEIRQWLRPVKRGLLGQFAVGTVDQPMLAATNIKYGVLRLLGLANKALIIDEIHSYDVYMSEILEELLIWCKALEIPVVMLSATLPPEMKKKLLRPYLKVPQTLSSAYPLLTAIDGEGKTEERLIPKTQQRQTVKLRTLPILHRPDKIAVFAAGLADEGGCICVLMNTVRQAQEVYRALKQCFDGELLLFHARFPLNMRESIEKHCVNCFGKDKTKRPKRAILVATQVVEQSLDVDFDAMLTAVAPIDLLFQRMGRIHRHTTTERPKKLSVPCQWILLPEDGASFGADGIVYPRCLLTQSVHLLKDRESVGIPEELATLVAAGYDERKVPDSEREAWIEQKIEDSIKAGQSRKYLIGSPDNTLPCTERDTVFEEEDGAYLSVKTRLGEPSVQIALLEEQLMTLLHPHMVERNGILSAEVKSSRLAREIWEQSLSVRRSLFQGTLEEVPYIRGEGLLSGMRIYTAKNGYCSTMHIDAELGFLIEEGES